MQNRSVDEYVCITQAKKADRSFWLIKVLVDHMTNEGRTTFLFIIIYH